VWLRQVLSDPVDVQSVSRLDEALVVRAQWSTWLAVHETQGTRWINPLWSSRRAENKIVQLRTARAVGLAIPATVVTNDAAEAADFSRTQPSGAVIKSLSAGYFAHSDQAFMFTTDVTDDVLSAVDAWRQQPLFVQRRLVRRLDIRVFVVEGFVAAAGTSSTGSDWRLQPDEADWTTYDLPARVADACRELTKSLGLVYGAIDLVDDGDEFWFLEINQAGEFQFLDRPLELGVADGLVTLLSGLA
jgi:glutathione synthase/RimK-type ligase-like ATP-grasp enzyme